MCFWISIAIADDKQVQFAQSLNANVYDKTLPPVQIEQWLKEVVPDHLNIMGGIYHRMRGTNRQSANR
jgi:predicted transglutaminase-like protease